MSYCVPLALALSAAAVTATVLLIGTGTAAVVEPLGRASVLRAEALAAAAAFDVVLDQPSVGL